MFLLLKIKTIKSVLHKNLTKHLAKLSNFIYVQNESLTKHIGHIRKIEHSPLGEVSLYNWSPVWQVWTQLLHPILITASFLSWSNPIVLNWRPAVAWSFPQRWVICIISLDVYFGKSLLPNSIFPLLKFVCVVSGSFLGSVQWPATGTVDLPKYLTLNLPNAIGISRVKLASRFPYLLSLPHVGPKYHTLNPSLVEPTSNVLIFWTYLMLEVCHVPSTHPQLSISAT